jgi:hypothetical protein
METSSPTTAVSPMTMPVPWSMNTPEPRRAAGLMSTWKTSHPALQVEGQGLAALAPQPVDDAVGLQGQEALEEQERLDIALAGRIALEHRHQVGLGGGDQAGSSAKASSANSRDRHGPQLLVAELARQSGTTGRRPGS